jgi:hypothetical protein
MKISFLLPLILFTAQGVFAQSVNSIPEIGKHYPIFSFEKNENPQNIMIVYTKLDSHCQVMKDANNNDAPTFDFYWRMDRQSYKPVHPMIKSGIRDRLKVLPAGENEKFLVEITDFKEVKSDISDARLTVDASETGSGECKVRALFKLGPSDNNANIAITSIYSEATKTLLPPFRKLQSITLNGVDTKTHKTISRKYLAK